MKRFEGIIFDLDDTLYSQASFKRSGFHAVAMWLNQNKSLDVSTVVTELEAIMSRKGPSYGFMFNDLANRLQLDPDLIPEMILTFITHRPRIACYPGVHSMLARLRQQFFIGILTDGRLDVQQRKIQALGLEENVDAILYSDSLGREKPDEALFAWFEDQLALNGEQLIYVGDNPQKDFFGAKRRKWTTLRVMTGEYASFKAIEGYEAHVTIPSVLDIKNWIAH